MPLRGGADSESKHIVMPGTQRVSKEKGELAEAAFLHKATELGFIVSKPWGDSAKYDFMVDGWGQISRVQVKSCATMRDGRAYAFNTYRRTCGVAVPYYPGEIDVFACYVVPEDAWYIMPVKDCALKKCLRVSPQAPERDRLYGKFREAWQWLGTEVVMPQRGRGAQSG